MKQILSLFFVLAISSSTAKGQSTLSELAFYCDVMINADDSIHRVQAHEKFEVGLLEYLETTSYESLDLEALKWISRLSDGSNSFKIISWQIQRGADVFSQHGLVVTQDSVFSLNDVGDEIEDGRYVSLRQDEWFGALYYNILPVRTEKEPYYILFGLDSKDKYTRRKVADVLSFEGGIPVFGKNIFITKDDGGRDDIMQRLVLIYSSDAKVSLNYNKNLDIIIHDHLIARMGNLPGQGPTQLPDGSFEGWKLEDGKWIYVEKIFNQISEEAPRPNPILDSKKKDLFGKRKN